MGAKKSNERMIENGKTVMNTHKRLVTKRAPYVPSTDNVREELRNLVKQHYALTKDATALGKGTRRSERMRTGQSERSWGANARVNGDGGSKCDGGRVNNRRRANVTGEE